MTRSILFAVAFVVAYGSVEGARCCPVSETRKPPGALTSHPRRAPSADPAQAVG
jgi:hypothetical protein